MNVLDQLKSALADRYEIEREVGAGGMATVYLARDGQRALALMSSKDDYQLLIAPSWRTELRRRLAAAKQR